ncbi:hypothetical protein DPEC_G00263940 [Dallia pectoralis]|uniref:Uncharacterized protein n=1 Tax=Dallia pectoralis TaxID=75939 RepID=A0ACC2FSL9_DALPE|nr:hypothetical protein DPEC_G00263940 [Dallia pectoralis]
MSPLRLWAMGRLLRQLQQKVVRGKMEEKPGKAWPLSLRRGCGVRVLTVPQQESAALMDATDGPFPRSFQALAQCALNGRRGLPAGWGGASFRHNQSAASAQGNDRPSRASAGPTRDRGETSISWRSVSRLFSSASLFVIVMAGKLPGRLFADDDDGEAQLIPRGP